jgi:predicted enzyme related to lactoylglutathione lyase
MTAEDATAVPGVDAKLARNGKVSYLHIPALDVHRSADFYAKVFGWSIGEPKGAERRSFEDPTGEIAGAFVTDAAPGEPGVLPYVYVTRIDNTVAKIEANGGVIERPVYAEGDLWVATFRDPAGNTMGIWQGGPR